MKRSTQSAESILFDPKKCFSTKNKYFSTILQESVKNLTIKTQQKYQNFNIISQNMNISIILSNKFFDINFFHSPKKKLPMQISLNKNVNPL